MAYVNPQLQSQTTDMILLLKEWVVNTSYKIALKEKYGEDICDCCTNNLIIAVKYVEMMQCYVFRTDDDVKADITPYNCLSEDELKLVIEKSKKITVSSGC